jgi:pyridoxal phosphate enzyme (YggS family)
MIQNLPEQISINYKRVVQQVKENAHSANREPSAVKIVVVTKGHPVKVVKAAISANIDQFGENYVEESLPKIDAIGKEIPITWHMIGHIQSRKAAQVIEKFDVIHSVDSLKLAQRLDRFAGLSNKKMPVFLECNTSGEASKFGFNVFTKNDIEVFLPIFEKIACLLNLRVTGLMTMAPFLDDPEKTRPYFQCLRKLKDLLNRQYPQNSLTELSMGMSADFIPAIQEGATIIRIGQAILGPRR